jgi:hypothetical protein
LPKNPANYNDFAKGLLARDINLLCVNRGTESLTSLTGVEPQSGDRVIYASEQRLKWEELVSM